MNAKRITTLLLTTFIFVFLFYRESIGLNILVMTAVLISARFIVFGLPRFDFLRVLSLSGLVLSALGIAIHNSDYALWIHFTSLLVYIGIESAPELRSIHWAFNSGFRNLAESPLAFLRQFNSGISLSPRIRFGLQKTYITIIPVLIIYIFLSIYRASNELFDERLHQIGVKFSTFMSRIFSDMDLVLFIMVAVGLVISSMFLFPTRIERLIEKNSRASDDLTRVRKANHFGSALKSFTLKDEYRSGIFLFACLNVTLLGLNVSDIVTIWTGFEWKGELLRSMVHSGTYLLIVSILLSMSLVLYYFRGNLNFYKQNKTLKFLCSIWLIQNSFLALSVLMRNYHYISIYNLAYKRIGVIFFVLLCLYGLYLIEKKISQKKTAFFLVSRMSMAVFMVLILSAFPNWDRIIARYNVQHAQDAFVHFDYLASLSDGSLDLLDIPLSELETMKRDQDQKFYSRSFYSGNNYLDAEGFHDRIEKRKKDFIQEYQDRSWKQWNYADHLVYHLLISKSN